jgi:hypothetical protein
VDDVSFRSVLRVMIFLHLAVVSDYGYWHFELATRKRKKNRKRRKRVIFSTSSLCLLLSGNRIIAMRYPGRAYELVVRHGLS